MSESSAMLPPLRDLQSLAPTADQDRMIRRRVGLAWGLLVVNVLTFAPGQSVLPIPSVVGKGLTQGALPLAVIAALSVNRRIVVRPNIFLCLVSLLAVEAVVTSLQAQYLFSTTYRTVRLVEFVVALWLLTPFWGRRDLLLVRCHLKAMGGVLASVILGLVVSPGHAIAGSDVPGGGRLVGAIWPIPPTQVAHYAAVTIGLVAVLWLCAHRNGWATLLVVVVAAAILILTHTRTALVAMIVGLLVAGLSLVVAHARVRRVFGAAAIIAGAAILTLSGYITSWLVRGEGTSQLIGLSGRTGFWGPLLAFPRDRFQEIFGFGLSNDSFNGLPIDSNWFASYQDQGLFGVVICAMILVFLFVAAGFQTSGERRALTLFLVSYCLVASFTEVGFTSASTYLLDLVVAASLLVPSAAGWRPSSRAGDRPAGLEAFPYGT